MPPAVLLSPIFLDQKFPRELNELRVVQAGLAVAARGLKDGRFKLIFSAAFEEFIDLTNTTWRESQTLNGALIDINRFLCQLIWRGEGVIRVQLPSDLKCSPHPVPERCDGDLVRHWADEVGRLILVHDSVCMDQQYFIGVLCPYCCCGDTDAGRYSGTPPRRCFPIGGSDLAEHLADAYIYKIPKTVHDRRVTVGEIIKNYAAIGGVRVESVKGTDHRRIVFSGLPAWEFDSNGGRKGTLVTDKAFGELEKLLGHPAMAIKASLMDGTAVEDRVCFRLCQYVQSSN